MKIRLSIILITLILVGKTVYGQVYEPLDLAKKIFAKDSFPDLESYTTGEYTGRPNGADIESGSTTKFLLLGKTENTAVVAMTILDSLGKGLDTYLHFKKDTVWKMSAFRALALTGIIEQIKIDLEKMTPQQVDEIIANSKEKKNNEFVKFTSIEDYNFQLGNVRLTLETDENIAKHFMENKAEFERLKNLASAQLEKEDANDENRIQLIENLKSDYQKIFISDVTSGGYELGNCINFYIGGILDNAVGYIYVKDKKDLPEMNSARVIMLREIGDGWYIYKTT